MTNHTNFYANFDLRKQIFLECSSMAGFALAKGISIPVNTVQSIEAFEEPNPSPTKAGENNSLQINKEIDITALIETHNALARLIEPATPKTILLLSREQENESTLKFLGPVSLVRQLMLASIFCLSIFIFMLTTPYINGPKLAEDVLDAEGLEQISRLIFYIGAAGLGASFAALYKVNIFISKGTFDPSYQSSYWVRFLLGIIAGLLLALLISEQSIQGDSMLSKGVIRPLLAILGGFSADLLYTFLSRMVETFKSLFEGSEQSVLDAKTQENKAKLDGLEVERRMKLAHDLIQMQQQMGEKTDPDQIKQQISEMLRTIMQSK